MDRILGVDYGDRRVGVAVSDPLGFGAQGVGTIENHGSARLIEELLKVITQYNPAAIVVGMPKNMDGTLGFRAEATEKFIADLKTVYNGEIVRWDERLTTVGAARYLNETNTRGKKRKSVIYTVSACLILEGYLSSRKS